MRFLAIEEVLEAHALLTAEDDDRPRVRDIGAIESAIERSKWGPFEVGDLAERAAFLLRGICQDHAFTNGNKRTAFTATESFLQLNGRVIVATPDEVVEFMLDVAQIKYSLKGIADWLRNHEANL